ncbi:undecaprenyl-diphosphate phosphatase [Bacillus sp. FJAT-45350]|uniref:undecaprenyl-diphosphate phosphatase n=1 Tax=Bacillus sp. FJAT-45350 TaxID=2011014 RepID=UPI0015CE842D|nr:undecaprenyl-diphosphate phosphatase [Bacillus sp. FJAT-45350]
MNWFEALLLGIIQGVTEFLPISSSAHLILAEKLLGLEVGSTLSFEVLLHLSSLIAVICFFWKDLIIIIRDFFSYSLKKKQESYGNYRFVWLMVIATVITMIVGKSVEMVLEERITNTATIGASLIITGIFLILIEHGITPGKRTEREMTWKDGVIVGLGQALAVIPGISRAGSTLIASLWCGLSKETAVRYSFLLSIPVIAGISIIKLPELSTGQFEPFLFELSIAAIASFVFAIIGIKWLIQMLNNAKLSYFAVYCIAIGLVTWVFLKDIPVA